MSKEIKTDSNIQGNLFNEGTFQIDATTCFSIAEIIDGLVPIVKTFAFITFETPYSISASSASKNQASENFDEKLRSMNLGYTRVGGLQEKENSFFIPNITKDETLMLGKLFSIETIIFAERNDKDDYEAITFQMIYTNNRVGEVVGEATIFINRNNKQEYYTTSNKHKVLLPFSQNCFSKSIFTYESGVINKRHADNTALKDLNELVDRILVENATPKSRWINRGSLNQKLKELID